MPTIDRLQVADSDAAAAAVLALILQAAAEAIASRGRFVFALCGGRTPGKVYELLADAEQDWRCWHLVYGDERCLPRDHEDRNSTMVEQCWLDNAGFPAENHHVPAMQPEAAVAAADYAADIEALLPLDFALLGMGEDGHTASLFPGHSHPQQAVVPVYEAPKAPPERISLSYATLCAAATVCFLVTGPSKRDALQDWLAGSDLPVARISGRSRTLLVTDIPAAT
jgi:6-phosphogluconolactonase